MNDADRLGCFTVASLCMNNTYQFFSLNNDSGFLTNLNSGHAPPVVCGSRGQVSRETAVALTGGRGEQYGTDID